MTEFNRCKKCGDRFRAEHENDELCDGCFRADAERVRSVVRDAVLAGIPGDAIASRLADAIADRLAGQLATAAEVERAEISAKTWKGVAEETQADLDSLRVKFGELHEPGRDPSCPFDHLGPCTHPPVKRGGGR